MTRRHAKPRRYPITDFDRALVAAATDWVIVLAVVILFLAAVHVVHIDVNGDYGHIVR